MSAISLKSITGITSITTPAGVDNQFTLHNSNTTEAVKLDTAGNLHFHNHLSITGVSTASNFKTGTSNLHNTGLNIQDLDVDGHTNLDNVSVAGVSTFSGVLDATNTPASIRVAQDIQHKGDADTKINFHDADKLRIELGGVTSAFSGLKSTSGAPHAKWGINIATPQAALHIDEAYNHQGLLRVTNGNQGTGYYHQLEMSGTQNIFTLWKHYDGSNYYNTHAHGSTGHRWFINGSEAVRIHSNSKVGIGTDNPSFFTHIQADGVSNDVLKITANGAGQMVNIQNRSNVASIVRFANYLANAFWDVQYNTDNSFALDYGDSEKFRIDNNGNFTFYNSAAAWNTLQRANTGHYIGIRIQETDATQRMQLGVAGTTNHIANGSAQHDVVLKSYANLLLATNQTERLRIDSGGDVTVNTGTLYIPQWISHVGDTDSKFGFLQPDIIQFDTASTTRLKIMNTGQIRIDQATSANNGIRMRPSGWNYDFRIGAVSSSGGSIWLGQNYEPTGGTRDSASYGTNYLRFTTGGDIYFGTGATDTNPTERLRINSAGAVNIGGNFTQTSYTFSSRGAAVDQTAQFSNTKTGNGDIHYIGITLTNGGYGQALFGHTGHTTQSSQAAWMGLAGDDVAGGTGIKCFRGGNVIKAGTCAFQAYNGAHTINQSSYIVFITTAYNVGGSYNTSNGVFTAPIAGRYLFTLTGLYTRNNASATFKLTWHINNSNSGVASEYQSSSLNNSYNTIGVSSIIFQLSANDTVRLYVEGPGAFHISGAQTRYSGYLLG